MPKQHSDDKILADEGSSLLGSSGVSDVNYDNNYPFENGSVGYQQDHGMTINHSEREGSFALHLVFNLLKPSTQQQ